jgi:hypothetical protein
MTGSTRVSEERLRGALTNHNLTSRDLTRLAQLVDYSHRRRQHPVRRLKPPKQDILCLIESAKDSGDLDEAVWRAFLAAHFARLSASSRDGSAESAAKLLYRFGDTPVWTWKRVASDHGKALKQSLESSEHAIHLSFGNHRSHEQPTTADLIETIRSFIKLASATKGPANIIRVPGKPSATERFDQLFHKLKRLHRFGRLGAFDFIDLLLECELVTACEPAHCYLKGATGPLRGAQLIWGKHDAEVLDPLAAELANKLDISCFAMEDALCNFQKAGQPCCGEPDETDHCTSEV